LASHLLQIQQANDQKLKEGDTDGEEKSQISFKMTELIEYYIDAKDTINTWCVAQIIEHDLANERITIHFDGWSDRYNEVSFNFANQNIIERAHQVLKNHAVPEVHQRVYRVKKYRVSPIQYELFLLSLHHQQHQKNYRFGI